MEKLRELRKKNKLSMKDFGAIFGLSESTISLYETGKREPDIATMINMANYFNISVDELLGIEKPCKEDVIEKDSQQNTNSDTSPVMVNFERMCSLLDEKILIRIHIILHSLRSIQKNSDIATDDKEYIFDGVADFIRNIELYVDNYQSASAENNGFDFCEYNKLFINSEIDIIKKIVNNTNPQKTELTKSKIVIPFYEMPASAGLGMWLNDDTPIEWVTVPRNKKTTEADFLLEVRGDSMQPKFFDGDRVLVKQSQSIYEGEIGVFILNNESYIKKMGRNELISLNPAYKPIKLKEYDDIRCAGKVIGTLDLQ